MTSSKNILFLAITCIFTFCTCSDDDCVEKREEFIWSSNKSIEIDPEHGTVIMGDSMINIISYEVTDGQDILFEFNEFSDACDDDIADGFGSRRFMMVIPSDSTNSFTYTDHKISETFAFLNIFAAPEALPPQYVEEGKITGKKTDDNSWRVSIDVITKIQPYGIIMGDQPEHILIDTLFTFQE